LQHVNGWGTWGASWAWSPLLVIVTIAIHAVGVVWIANVIEQVKPILLRQRFRYLDSGPGAIAIIVAVALSLAVLHAIESMAWAVAYPTGTCGECLPGNSRRSGRTH